MKYCWKCGGSRKEQAPDGRWVTCRPCGGLGYMVGGESGKGPGGQPVGDADDNFAVMLGVLTAALVGYWDYTNAPAWPWYGHALFIGLPALGVGWFFTRFRRITSLLRKCVILVILVYAGLYFTDMLPEQARLF